jgi:hypothetical protein
MSPARRPTLTVLRNDEAHTGLIDHGLSALLNHAYDAVQECRKTVSESKPVPAELTERLSSISDGIDEAAMNLTILALDPSPGTLRTRAPQYRSAASAGVSFGRLARHLHSIDGDTA